MPETAERRLTAPKTNPFRINRQHSAGIAPPKDADGGTQADHKAGEDNKEAIFDEEYRLPSTGEKGQGHLC